MDTPLKVPSATRFRPSQRGETILVVDDELALRTVASTLLTKLGYRVIMAENGAEALKVVEDEGSAIDLIISDVVMPFCSGPEFVSSARSHNEGLKVLYVSGFCRSHFDDFPEEKSEPFLPKPYTIDQLSETVHAILNDECSPKADRTFQI